MQIKFIYPEGSTPIDDISGLKISWINTQAQLNRVESENISYAIEKHLMSPVKLPHYWFNIPNLKKIHRDMFHDIWDWAGSFRIFQTIPGITPSQIQSALKDLCDDITFWNSEGCEMTFIEQAARIHHRLVYIHPFPNGNGRFSRIIADRYLKSWKCPFPFWPKELHDDGQIRKEYISSLKSADAANYNPLRDFIKRWGGKDPPLSILLSDPFYKKNLKTFHLNKLIKAYLKHDYNINESANGNHPLQLAIKQSLDDIAILLIDSGADLFNRDKSGYTPFEMAISKNNLNLAKTIYDHGYPYTPKQTLSAKLLENYPHLYEFNKKYF